MGTRSHMMEGSQVMRKTGSVVSSAAVGLALAAMALTVMEGCEEGSFFEIRASTSTASTLIGYSLITFGIYEYDNAQL